MSSRGGLDIPLVVLWDDVVGVVFCNKISSNSRVEMGFNTLTMSDRSQIHKSSFSKPRLMV